VRPCESCSSEAVEHFADVRYADGSADLLLLCSRCLAEVAVQLDEGDLVDVGPVDVFGEPLEICRN